MRYLPFIASGLARQLPSLAVVAGFVWLVLAWAPLASPIFERVH